MFHAKTSTIKICPGRFSIFKSFYPGAYLIFWKLENNYFLHASLWSKQVTFTLIFLKCNQKLLNNTYKFLTNKFQVTNQIFRISAPLQGDFTGDGHLKEVDACSSFEVFLGAYCMWAPKRCWAFIRIFTVIIFEESFIPNIAWTKKYISKQMEMRLRHGFHLLHKY